MNFLDKGECVHAYIYIFFFHLFIFILQVNKKKSSIPLDFYTEKLITDDLGTRNLLNTMLKERHY